MMTAPDIKNSSEEERRKYIKNKHPSSGYPLYKVLKQSELMDYMKWYYNNI